MTWQDRITTDQSVCHGRPCIKGTRVMASVILDNLAAGESYDAIIEGYQVSAEDIHAALLFAADLARDRVIVLPAGAA